MTRFDPLDNRVLIREPQAEDRVAASGIILPAVTTENSPSLMGTVIKTGPGRVTESGKLIRMRVKKGDVVVFAKFAGTRIVLDDVPHLVLRDDDIVGIAHPEPKSAKRG